MASQHGLVRKGAYRATEIVVAAVLYHFPKESGAYTHLREGCARSLGREYPGEGSHKLTTLDVLDMW